MRGKGAAARGKVAVARGKGTAARGKGAAAWGKAAAARGKGAAAWGKGAPARGGEAAAQREEETGKCLCPCAPKHAFARFFKMAFADVMLTSQEIRSTPLR